jgi:hypothetical protein
MVLRVVGLGPFLALFFLLLMATASAAFEVTSATSAVACESFALSWPGAQLPVY